MGLVETCMELSGYLLVATGTYIRIYSAVFIYGRKTTTLVTSGPYSVVRNPLYLGSLLAAIGLGLVSENLLFLGLIVLMFVAYYPWVVLGEEDRLRTVHGSDFEAYCFSTPRFIPAFRLFHEPEFYEVNTRKLKWAFLDGLAFVWGALGVSLIEAFHDFDVIPILLRFP